MASPIHCFEFLAQEPPAPLPHMVVLAGGQRYLTTLARHHLRGHSGDDWSEVQLDTEFATWSELIDELSAQSLFGGSGKLVVLADADGFVSQHRERLESLAARGGSNTLLLTVKQFPKNTKLYKLVVQHGLLIECSTPVIQRGKTAYPDNKRIGTWISQRALSVHGLKLGSDAARRLCELTDSDVGRMDQELAKMALMTEPGQAVSAERVQHLVGGWQLQTAWKVADAAVDGDAATALALLDQLFQSGQEAFGLFAQVAWSLRRYAQVHAAQERLARGNPRASIGAAIELAGFQAWEGKDMAPRVARIGAQRLNELSHRLLSVDAAMKRTHSSEQRARLALENLVFWLAGPSR